MTETLADDVVIDIVEDIADAITIVDGDGTAAASAPAAPLTEDPQAALSELQRRLDESERARKLESDRARRETQRRVEAEQLAVKNAGAASHALAAQADTQYDSIVNAHRAAETEMDGLQAQKAAAYEKGEYEGAAKLDKEMAKIGARIVQFEMAKADLEQRREAAKTAPPPQPVSPQQQNEEWLGSLPPETAYWIRQHPEFFSNPAFQSRVLAAAEYAERVKELTNRNPDYFRFIEEETGLRARDAVPAAIAPPAAASLAAAVQDRQSAAPPPRPAPTPAAAPTRTVPDAANPNGAHGRKQVTLTAEERALARQMFPDAKDPDMIYARNKLALVAEGKIHQGRQA